MTETIGSAVRDWLGLTASLVVAIEVGRASGFGGPGLSLRD